MRSDLVPIFSYHPAGSSVTGGAAGCPRMSRLEVGISEKVRESDETDAGGNVARALGINIPT